MLSTTSTEFRKFFLLEFTRQIIKHYAFVMEINLLENKKPETFFQKNIEQTRKTFKPLISSLRIPENQLPLRLQYLKPIPTQSDLNLGKLNEVFKDKYVKSIECNGIGEAVIVNSPTSKQSNIILEQKDIEEIIKEFSRVSKIPVHEGIYKVAAGHLILLAAISEIVKTRFIIKRIPFNQII